jgi:transcription initiation factor TFIID TATA-box-binding protein
MYTAIDSTTSMDTTRVDEINMSDPLPVVSGIKPGTTIAPVTDTKKPTETPANLANSILGTVSSAVTATPAATLSEVAPLATIHNLVGTCEIQSSVTPIDLELVYRSLANSFYCRRRFAAITIRVTDPVCTGLLFTSGKLVITGCKTLIECVLASLKIVRMLQRHIPTVTFLVRNAVVQNVVAHVVIPLKPGQRLNVDRLYETWCCNCTFQKNMFPGLIFRPDKSPVVLLLFYSVYSPRHQPINTTP